MRAIWNGAIGFGLVNIPVKLYSATQESSIDLDMLDKADYSNIKFKRVNEKTGKEVKYEDIVKGYKMEDRYIVLEKSDFEAVSPEKSRLISIKQFVEQDEIDAAYFETPYFLEPQKNGEEAYQLMLTALLKTKKTGLGTFILRDKEILCSVRPYEDSVLMLNRMRFPEELRSFEDLTLPKKKKAGEEEVKMAEMLIKQFSTKFNTEKYKDTYHDELMKIIKQKAKGKTIAISEDKNEPTKATDLMALLKASLENSEKKAG